MADEKPFICYQSGTSGWTIKIAPRNAEGWRYSAYWMLAFGLMTAAFIPFAENIWALAIYMTSLLIWTIAMIRWMKARSDIVNTDELLALKKELDARKQRRR